MRTVLLNLFFLLAVTSTSMTIVEAKQPTLSFTKVSIPEAPPVAAVMVAYMTIDNKSHTEQTISKIFSPQFKRVEIHMMSMKNGMMDMKELKSVSINNNQPLVLESGGLHIMLIKPIKPLRDGDSVELNFELNSGELITITSSVRATN